MLICRFAARTLKLKYWKIYWFGLLQIIESKALRQQLKQNGFSMDSYQYQRASLICVWSWKDNNVLINTTQWRTFSAILYGHQKNYTALATTTVFMRSLKELPIAIIAVLMWKPLPLCTKSNGSYVIKDFLTLPLLHIQIL